MQASADIVVVGSGAAALSAALAAADGGAEVLVLEKSDRIGGTSAMSGAGIWVPANHLARAAGLEDSKAAALAYLRATAPAGWADDEDPLWASFAEHAPEALALIDRLTPIEFELTPEPDPMAEHEGGRTGGRMLSPRALRRAVAGPFARRIRTSTLPHLFTYVEAHEMSPYSRPVRAVAKLAPKLAARWLTGARGQGSALVAGLIRGCLDAGVHIELGAEVTALSRDDMGAVTGVELRHDGRHRRVAAQRGVVLATGGFEWDVERRERHFPGLTDRIGSPRTNTGDGQRLAEQAGAALVRMDQANVYATLPTRYEGHLHGMPATFHGPRHCIVVDRHAKRFASELDYNLGEHIDARDATTGAPVHPPCWMIADARFLAASGMFRWYARKQPGWLRRAATLSALAEAVGLDAGALTATVERWNGFAAGGRDEDFQRGETAWERYRSGATTDDRRAALGAVDQAPFVAAPLNRSILVTKGGPRTDANGQVLRPDGTAIAGLYCAGAAMANPIGTRAVGAGTTLGPCLTWGYICARSLLRSNRSNEESAP